MANNGLIKIFVDGVEVKTDQPPLIINNRALVPLRAIFEALNAIVDYQEGDRRIIASRADMRMILYPGFTQALVNNKQVTLDVPAQIVNNRTLVPVRFVSETLGDFVHYDSSTRQVHISRKQSPLSNVNAKDIADFGDGRDLEVSFNKATNETRVSEYQIMVVKTSNASTFDLNSARQLSSSNYTVVPKNGSNIRRSLTSSTRDTDGALLESDISYTVFVLQLGNGGWSDSFLAKSAPITLTLKDRVAAITNLQVRDAFDYGDGRDIEVSFTKIADETRLLHYRAIVVPANESSQFNLSAAKEVTSPNYTTIHRTGQNIVQTLSSPRDYKGRLIQDGIGYRVYILSVGNSFLGFGSSLSSPSAQITLMKNSNDIRAMSVTVKDISDFGDGRDLEVSFKIPSQEIRVSNYRVMVVPALEVNTFTLEKANNVSSANYTTVHKTGRDHTVALSSSTRDV